MNKRLIPLWAVGLLLSGSVLANQAPERVLLSLPAGFELGFKQDQAGQLFREYVPKGQKVSDWTKMITVQQLDGSLPARDLATKLLALMLKVCPEAKVGILEGSNDESAGYVTSCPKSPQTNQPELTIYQTMRGWKYTYTIQMSFSGKHTKEAIYQTKDFMSGLRVCEEGQSDAACRASKHSGSNVAWASFFSEEAQPKIKTTEMRTPGGAKIVNHEAAVNVAPNAKLGCIAIKDVTNKMNPPALYMAARACIDQGQLDRVSPLLATAGDYGFYDVSRLSDKTTAGAPRAAVSNAFSGLPDESVQAIQARYRVFEADPAQVANQCQVITKLGPPAYTPTWAINHGIEMFTGKAGRDPYLHDVDAKSLWNGIVKRRCTPRKPS